jgi:hypothetical protein
MHDDGPSPEDLKRFGGDEGYCPECGKRVWDQAEVCPACDAHLGGNVSSREPVVADFQKRLALVVILATLIAFLLVVLL